MPPQSLVEGMMQAQWVEAMRIAMQMTLEEMMAST